MTLGGFITTRARQMDPGAFAMVMATGIVSINLASQNMPVLGIALFWLNVLAYVWLLGLTVLRLVLYRREMFLNFVTPGKGAAFLTLSAGTCVLATQCILVVHLPVAARILSVLGGIFWLVLVYLFIFVSIVRHLKATFSRTVNGSWLVVVVSTQALAVTTALLGSQVLHVQLLFFFGTCLYLVGCAWYLIFITFIVHRMMLLPFNAREFTPPYWINMGALAISALAGSLIILDAPLAGPLHDLLPFVKGFTLFYWASASWWIPLLVMLTLWRHLWHRIPLDYQVADWNIVFPIGMYIACTRTLSHATNTEFLMGIPYIGVYVSLLVWVLVALGLCFRLYHYARDPVTAQAPDHRN